MWSGNLNQKKAGFNVKDLMKLYQELYVLTRKEEELINGENYEELINHLKEKNELIQQIEGIDQKEYIMKSNNPKEVYNNLLNILESLKTLEDKNIAKLNKDFSQAREQLKSIYKGIKSRQGYNISVNFREAKFIDKKG